MSLRSGFLFLFFWLGSTALAGAATGEACPLNQEHAFSAAIYNEDLVAAQRAYKTPEYEYELRQVEERFSQYLSFPLYPGDDRPNALLFYVAREGIVCLFAYDRRSTSDDRLRVRNFLISADASEFSARLAGHIESVQGTARRIERAPKRIVARGAEAIARGSLDAGDALEAMRDMLVPGELRAELESFRTLSILPALNIGTVPFAAIDADGDGEPLLASVTVNIEASAYNVYQLTAFGWGPGFESVAIFGDPEASNDPEWHFPRLPGAVAESKAIAEIVGGEPLFGRDVTRSAVIDALQSSDYVHIAAHGISSTENPMEESFLALSDGRLVGIDIELLPLPAGQLVVLSACQSGLGKVLDGGVAGLSRAFIYGGSAQVISSLWNVEDEATSWTMIRFAELLNEHAPAEALRRAQNEARQRWPDPRVWAAFVAFGGRIVFQ